MLAIGGVDDGERRATRALADGSAYERFVALVEAQGATRDALEALSVAPHPHEIRASSAGIIAAIDAVALGNAARRLTQRHSTAGVELFVRVGEKIERGQPMATIYGEIASESAHDIQAAFVVAEGSVAPPPLLLAQI